MTPAHILDSFPFLANAQIWSRRARWLESSFWMAAIMIFLCSGYTQAEAVIAAPQISSKVSKILVLM
jgi:hypothetical protein